MKLAYKKSGSGKPMIILHGLFGSSDNWQTLGKKIAENFELYLVDQRNHGHSPNSDEFSYDLMQQDLLEFIKEHNLRDVILVGHSMGGKVAMLFAQNHPEFIEKLIVVDIGYKGYPVHHDKILAGLMAIKTDEIDSRGEAEDILKQHIDEESVRQFLLKNLYWEEKGKLGWRINIPVINREIEAISNGLPENEVSVPTLFIRGEKSNYIIPEDYSDIRSLFKNVKIETLNTGHWIHAEDPKGFYKLLTDFAKGENE